MLIIPWLPTIQQIWINLLILNILDDLLVNLIDLFRVGQGFEVQILLFLILIALLLII